jgi:HK97 family phage major capsid protein
MDNKEMIEALAEHGKAIEVKNADLQKAMEAKMTEAVTALKAELAEMVKTREVMQKQLDDQNIAIQVAKKTSPEVETFAQSVKKQLDKEIAKIVGMKNLINTKEQVSMELKTFLQTNNASVTTGSLIPTPQFETTVSKAPDRRVFMLELVSRALADSLYIYWPQRKTRTDNSEFVAEGVKPAAETILGYETKSQAMQNLSSFLKVSNNSLDDVEWLQSEIQTELVTLMMLKLDAALLTGTVATVGFDGVLTAATAFAAGGDDMPAGVEPNKFDALVFAATQVEIENFTPNYIVLHPADVRDMKLTRDDSGAYLLPPQITQGVPVVDGIRVVSNTGMTKGTYLVGDFSKAKFWTRKNMELRFWEQNEDDAIAQVKTVTLYMRGTLVIKDADKKAFVTDTFADTIAEITNPGA